MHGVLSSQCMYVYKFVIILHVYLTEKLSTRYVIVLKLLLEMRQIIAVWFMHVCIV